MNPEGPVTVLAHWSPGAQHIDEVLALIVELRRQTLAEPGCSRYEVFRSVDKPGELLLVEGYEDGAAIESHRASPHYQQLVVQRILPLLAQRRIELLVARPPE